LEKTGRKKSVGPDCIPGEILKMGGEALIPYLARLLDITITKDTIPRDWRKAIVVPIYKGGAIVHSVIQNYGPVSLTSVVCKQMKHVIAGYRGCPRRNVPDFGRVFLMVKYTDITQNTYVQS
jgi:hypothetical protein